MFPQRGTDFFADHRGARPQVLNTVARGQLHEDSYFYTGVVQGANGYREEQNLMPFPVTMEVLKRGQERFNIYCTPCHSRVGNGLGEIVQRGYKPAANLHDQVRMSQPLSHYFYVMTHGYGAMPDYSAQLTPEDRWAVAAYIRALQLSQAATPADVPAGVQVQDLKSIAAAEGHPEYAAALGAAGDGGAGLSARRQGRHAGHGSGQSGRPGDQDSSKQTGRHRGREVRTDGMAHESRDTREDAPRRPERAGLCRRLEEARAHGGSSLLGYRGCRSAYRGRIGRPLSARLGAGLDAHLRLRVGGLALLMVQYCSGGKWGLLLRRPLEAMSRTLPLVFVYWLRRCHRDEEALPVGAVHQRERHGGGAARQE